MQPEKYTVNFQAGVVWYSNTVTCDRNVVQNLGNFTMKPFLFIMVYKFMVIYCQLSLKVAFASCMWNCNVYWNFLYILQLVYFYIFYNLHASVHN